jgi:hypothetical protein
MLESASGKEQRMKKSRFTEAQVAFALRQAESGTPVAEIIRKLGISEQTFYRITGWPSYFLIGADGQIIVAVPGGENIDIAGELAKLFADHKYHYSGRQGFRHLGCLMSAEL